MKTRIFVIAEVKETVPQFNNDVLCLQKVTYQYAEGGTDEGFRFIYRDSAGRMKAQRGQANLVSLDLAAKMIKKATSLGWDFKKPVTAFNGQAIGTYSKTVDSLQN